MVHFWGFHQETHEAYVVFDVTYERFIKPHDISFPKPHISDSFFEFDRIDITKVVFSILHIWVADGEHLPSIRSIICDNRSLTSQMQGAYGEALTVGIHFTLKSIRAINIWCSRNRISSKFYYNLWDSINIGLYPDRCINMCRNSTHLPDFVTVSMNVDPSKVGVVNMLTQEIKTTFKDIIPEHDKTKFQSDAESMLRQAYGHGINIGQPENVFICVGITNVLKSRMDQRITITDGFYEQLLLDSTKNIKFWQYCEFIMGPLDPSHSGKSITPNIPVFESVLNTKFIECTNSMINQRSATKSGSTIFNNVYSMMYIANVSHRECISRITLTTMFTEYSKTNYIRGELIKPYLRNSMMFPNMNGFENNTTPINIIEQYLTKHWKNFFKERQLGRCIFDHLMTV